MTFLMSTLRAFWSSLNAGSWTQAFCFCFDGHTQETEREHPVDPFPWLHQVNTCRFFVVLCFSLNHFLYSSCQVLRDWILAIVCRKVIEFNISMIDNTLLTACFLLFFVVATKWTKQVKVFFKPWWNRRSITQLHGYEKSRSSEDVSTALMYKIFLWLTIFI